MRKTKIVDTLFNPLWILYQGNGVRDEFGVAVDYKRENIDHDDDDSGWNCAGRAGLFRTKMKTTMTMNLGDDDDDDSCIAPRETAGERENVFCLLSRFCCCCC